MAEIAPFGVELNSLSEGKQVQINTINGFAQSLVSSGRRVIGGIALPDFNHLQYNTKTKPAMSDEKYREAIIAQAKKDQAIGKFHSRTAEYLSLRKSHLSVVSPDRNGIITEGLTVISQQSIKEPLQLWELLYGKVSYKHEPQQKVTFAKFYDSDGELIATYSSTGQPWDFFPTHAEKARSNEFLTIYNDAWGEAARAAGVNATANTYSRSDMPSYGFTNESPDIADSFDGAPEIEYFNNYTPSGKLYSE